MSLNLVNLVGRTGRDPEVRFFESGNVVCKVSLAVDRRRKGEDAPDWFELEMWGKTAEIAGNYLTKGKQIGITGSLKFDQWKDRATGEDRQRPVIAVDRLDLLGSRRDEGGASGPDEEF